MSEDRKIPVVDFHDKKAVLNAAMLDTGNLSSTEKNAQERLKKEAEKAKAKTTIMKFTEKEISLMAQTFRKEFIANGLAAHVIKRQSGKRSFCYEIRYRSNGYNITASSTDLQEAKKKFLSKTIPSEIEKYRIPQQGTGVVDNLLEHIFEEWYQYRKGHVTEKVINTHRKHFFDLPDNIRKKPIATIHTNEIEKCLDGLGERMREEYRSLFNMLFTYAIASGILLHNPVKLIPFKRAERQNREALSPEEIQMFLKNVENPKYQAIRQAAYFYYFFGLRASEIDHETRREGDFLITRNRKRKGGKIEYKKIPIPLQAQGLIKWDEDFSVKASSKKAGELFHDLLGENKTAYNLRHTFASICAKRVREDIVELWMGDSPERLVGKVYIHFSDDFMREQMDMVVFPTLESFEI